MKLNDRLDFSFITKKTWTRDKFFNIFCYIMLAGICIFVSSLFVLGFNRWVYLFHILINPYDSFMDFFNPIYWAQFKDVYTIWNASNYLPFSYLIFRFFSFLIPSDILVIAPVIIRRSIYGAISLLFFLGFSLIPLLVVIFKNKMGSVKEKIIFSLFMIFSTPFIGSLERGNIIFIALFFMVFFAFYYDSDKWYLRQLSLLFLAASIAIKIYPAAMGMLLLREKRYKDILLLGVYVLCLTIFPFFLYNGLSDIKLFLNNSLAFSQKSQTLGYGYSENITTTIKMIYYAITKHESILLNTLAQYISYLALLLGIVAAYFIKKKWKTVAITCLLMVLIPSISWTYTLLFMIPSLIMFLNDNEEKSFKDLIYLILFCFLFILNIPAKAPIFMPPRYPVLIDNFCARLACLIMFIMLLVDGIKDLMHNKKSIN